MVINNELPLESFPKHVSTLEAFAMEKVEILSYSRQISILSFRNFVGSDL